MSEIIMKDGAANLPPKAEWDAINAALAAIGRRFSAMVDGETLALTSSYHLSTIYEPSSGVEINYSPTDQKYRVLGRVVTVDDAGRCASSIIDHIDFKSGDPSIANEIAINYWMAIIASTLPRMVDAPFETPTNSAGEPSKKDEM